MTEVTETTERQKTFTFEGLSFPLAFGLSNPLFREFLPVILAFFLGGLLSTCISYFFLSKPRVRFIRYFTTLQAILLITIAMIFLIPQILQEIIPAFWAYSLPLFVFMNALYFVPPLVGKNREAWWKWFLLSLIIGIVYGLFGSYIPL